MEAKGPGLRLFLDTSVLLAASGSEEGASFAVLTESSAHGCLTISSPYCVAEAERNVAKLGPSAIHRWRTTVRPLLQMVADQTVLDKPLLLGKAKDRPVIITALSADCGVLLTLDRVDFGRFFERGVYGLDVLTPGAFLARFW